MDERCCSSHPIADDIRTELGCLDLGCIECGRACCAACGVWLESVIYCRGCAGTFRDMPAEAAAAASWRPR